MHRESPGRYRPGAGAVVADPALSPIAPEIPRSSGRTLHHSRQRPRLYANPFCPFMVSRRHVFDSLRILISQIVQFRAVCFHVIELPITRMLGHEFPFPSAAGVLAFLSPKIGALPSLLWPWKYGGEAFALQWNDA